jgi:hypothetical protein
MLWLLAATLVAGWRYEGFDSDPPPPPAVPSPPQSVPAEPVGPEPASEPAPKPAPGPDLANLAPAPLPLPVTTAGTGGCPHPALKQALVPRPPAAKAKRPIAPSLPRSWRLADVSGQVWEDPDPSWLRRWVVYRNASLTGYRMTSLSDPIETGPAGRCTSGRCERPR